MNAHHQTVIVETSPQELPSSLLPFAFTNKKQYADYRRRLWQRDPTCAYCRKRIASGKETLDHIQPKSQGGMDTPSNLVLACEKCNQAKDARSMVEWAHDIVQACVDAGQTLTAVGVG